MLATSDRFTLKLALHDGNVASSWDSDPGTHAGTLRIGRWQHVAVIVDGGAKIATFVIDGILNDGGAAAIRLGPLASGSLGRERLRKRDSGARAVRWLEIVSDLRSVPAYIGSGRQFPGRC